DTIGVATPRQVDEVLALLPDKKPLAVHFHDTRGTAIANCLHAIEQGIRVVDSSAGGLGGCPYAKGASGNLATEDLLYMLHGMGFSTGVNLDQVCAASEMLEKEMELSLPSRYFKAWKGGRK
ncbi:MAG: hydroxymethylglutaryl-CoA lyase, partial [Bdellovibrionota bacterium]